MSPSDFFPVVVENAESLVIIAIGWVFVFEANFEVEKVHPYYLK